MAGCRIRYNRSGDVSTVLAKNGKESRLFKAIKSNLGIRGDSAVHLYMLTETSWFKQGYTGKYDENQEPLFREAREMLTAFSDTTVYAEFIEEKLSRIGEKFSMDQDGFFPPNVNEGEIREAIKAYGLNNVKVKSSAFGLPYLALNGNFFNPNKKHYYRNINRQAAVEHKINNAIGKLIDDLGIQIEWTDKLREDTMGRADTMNRIIQLAEGKARPEDLNEEAVHIAIAAIRMSPEYAQMMTAIDSMPVYKEVVESYSTNPEYMYTEGPNKGLPSDRKLREEAVVKHLLDEIGKAAESRPWWKILLDALKNIFNTLRGVDSVSSFRRVADKILQHRIGDLNPDLTMSVKVDDNVSPWFYNSEGHIELKRKLQPNKAKQQMVSEQMKQWRDQRRDMVGDRYSFELNGKTVVIPTRVTEIVRKYQAQLYKEAESMTPEQRRMYLTNGSIMHAYSEIIMNVLKEGVVENYDDLISDGGLSNNVDQIRQQLSEQVYIALKDNTEFVEGNFEREYYNISEEHWNTLVRSVGSLYESIIDMDDGAEILTEQIVLKADNTVAGTVDVMVVHSDGTIGIYDYKTLTRKSIGDTILPLDPRKIEGYDTQLGIYRDIISDKLGLERYDFREMRIIPLSVTYKNGKINEMYGAISGNTVRAIRERNAARDQIMVFSQQKVEGLTSWQSRYLDPISVANEIVPGDPQMNEFLDKLYAMRTDLTTKFNASRGAKKRQYKNELRIIQEAINGIVVLNDISIPIKELEASIYVIKHDITRMDNAQLLTELNRMKVYDEMYTALKPQFDKIADSWKIANMDKTVKEAIDDVAKQNQAKGDKEMADTLGRMIGPAEHFNGLVDQGIKALQQEIINRASKILGDDPQGNPDIKKILQGNESAGLLANLYLGQGYINEPVLKAISQLLWDAHEKQKLKYINIENRITKAYRDLETYAKKSGLGTKKMYEPFITDKKTLITPFTARFYEDLEERIKTANDKKRQGQDYQDDLNWIKEHVDFNESLWNEHYAQREQEWEGYTEEGKLEAKAMFEALNPNLNPDAYLRKDNWYVKRPKHYSEPAMASYISPEWNRIQSSPELLNFYNTYTEILEELIKLSGEELITHNFIPNFRHSFVEGLAEFSARDGLLGGILNASKVGIKNAFMVTETDEVFGYRTADGKIIDRIPILGVAPLWQRIDKINRNIIENELRKDPAFTEDTPEFNKELEKRIYDWERRNSLQEKSTDLTKGLMLLSASVLDYHYKSQVENDVLMVREVMEMDRYKSRPMDEFGSPLKDKLGKRVMNIMGASNEMKELVDKFIKLNMYGQRQQGQDVKVGSVSGRKVLNEMHRYLTAKSLGLNIIMGSASHVNAVLQSRFMASMGTYFTKEGLKKARSGVINTEAKAFGLLTFLDPISKDTQRERAELKSKNWWERNATIRNLLIFARGGGKRRIKDDKDYEKRLKEKGFEDRDNPLWGDDYVSSNIVLAIAHDWVLDSDGVIKMRGSLMNPPIDPDAKSIYELFDHKKLETIEEFNEDTIGELFPGLSWKEYTRFKRIAGRAQFEALGRTNMDTEGTYNTNIQGQLSMKFRGWIPGLFYTRFSKGSYDDVLRDYRQGFTAGTAQYIFMDQDYFLDRAVLEGSAIRAYVKEMALPAIKKLVQFVSEMLSFGMYKHKMSEERVRHLYNKTLAEYNLDPSKFTFEKFMGFKERQWRTTIADARWATFTLQLIAFALKSMFGADEDDAPLPLRWMYELTKRTQLELSFFWSLDSVGDIIKSPFPVTSLFVDLGKAWNNFQKELGRDLGLLPENKRDKSPYFYYTGKSIPGLRQIMRLSYLFPMYRDEEPAWLQMMEYWWQSPTEYRGKVR